MAAARATATTAATIHIASAPAPTAAVAARQHRLRRPPAWVIVWMGLVVEVTLGTALLAGTAPPVPQLPSPAGAAPMQQAQRAPAEAEPAPKAPAAADQPSSPPQPGSVIRAESRGRAVVANAGPDVASVPPTVGSEGTPAVAPAAPAITVSLPEGAASSSAAVGAGPPLAPSRSTLAAAPAPAQSSPQPSSASGQAAFASSMSLISADHHSARRQSLWRGARAADTKTQSALVANSVGQRWFGWSEQGGGGSLPPLPTTPGPSTLGSANGRRAAATGYIGVYAPGPNGVRVFRAGP